MKREWRLQLDSDHVVMLEHGYLSGKAVINLDGKELCRRKGTLWDAGFEHRFLVEDVPCLVRVLTNGFTFTYELWLDSKLQ